MRVERSWRGAVVVVIIAACDTLPSDQRGTRVPIWAPSFSVLPGGLSQTGCEQGVAWAYSAHFEQSSTVTFISPDNGQPRSQCGDLGFNEPSVANLELRYTPVIGRYEKWLRRLRTTSGFPPYEDTVFPLDSVDIFSLATRFWDAPAQLGYDLTAFTIRHSDNISDTASPAFNDPDSNLGEARAQLWRHIDPPYITDTALLGSGQNQPRLVWLNRHLGREVDSTEVYRSIAGGSWTPRATLTYSFSEFVDTALARGVYAYFVRHITAHGLPGSM